MSFYISKEDLEYLYFIEGLSYSKIEKKLNLKRGVIYHWFKNSIKGKEEEYEKKFKNIVYEKKKNV